MSQNVRKKPVKRRETYNEDEAYDEEAYERGAYRSRAKEEEDEEEWEEVVIRRPKKKTAADSGSARPAGNVSAGTHSGHSLYGSGSGGRSAGAAGTGSRSAGNYVTGSRSTGSSGSGSRSAGNYAAGSRSTGSSSVGSRSAGSSGTGSRSAGSSASGSSRRAESSGTGSRNAGRRSSGTYDDYEEYRPSSHKKTASSGRNSRAYREQEESGGLMVVVVAITGVLVLAFACVAGYLFLQKNAVAAQREEIAAVGEQMDGVGDGGLSMLQNVGREQAAVNQAAVEEEAARLEEEQRQQEEEEQAAVKEAEKAQKPAQEPAQPTLTDTVEFVESTTTDTGSTVDYAEVAKDQVTDPGTKSMAADYAKLTSVTGIDIYSGDTCVTGGAVFVNVGESVTLKAAVSPDNADDQRVEWESIDKSTATVDANRGIVTGVRVDDTIIIARSYDGSYEAKIWIKVRNDVKASLNHNAATVSVGGTAHLEVSAENGGGKVDVSWKNSDSSVAEINSDGTVTGKKQGKTTITAVSKSNGETLDSCVITVANNGIAVNLNKDKLHLEIGASEQLKAEVWGTSDTGIRWYSTDTSVASVSTNGTVTGQKAGVITVIAYSNKDENSYAYCDVYVGGGNPDPKKDTATKLKDKAGNQLYVKDSKNNYIEATNADYYTHDKFYKKVETKTHKYTGWHDFKGKKYYFDKTGKLITGEQVIQGKKYVFGTDGVLQE